MENAFNLSVCLCKSKELNCGLHWMHFHSKMVVDLKGYRRLSVADSRQRGVGNELGQPELQCD